MAKFSLFFDGFSIAAAQEAQETAQVLAQALNKDEQAIQGILQRGSGILAESNEQAELEELSKLVQSLGLNCSITSTAESTAESIADPTLTLGEEIVVTNAIREDSDFNVDDLVHNLEHSKLQPDDKMSFEQIESIVVAKNKAAEAASSIEKNVSQQTSEKYTRDESIQSSALNTNEEQLDWGQTDALSFVKQSRRTERLVDIATVAIIAFLTSLLFFFFDNQNDFEKRMLEQAKYVESLIKLREAEDREVERLLEKPDPDVIPTTLQMTGRTSKPQWEINSDFYISEGQLKSIDLNITTPTPPNLTDEEIITKTPRRPWMSRIVVTNLSIRQREDNKFIATGKARAFIEYKDRKLSSLAETVVTGELLDNKVEVTGRLMINRGYDQIPLGDQVMIETVNDDDFRFFVAVPVVARYTQPDKK